MLFLVVQRFQRKNGLQNMMLFLIMCLEMIRTKQYTECLICGKQGIEQAGDILPDKGILIQVIHEDGNICKFVEYSSISTFLDRSKKQNPRMISCPICRQNGRIRNFRPSKSVV